MPQPPRSSTLPWWAAPALAVEFATRIPVPWTRRLTPDQARLGLARAMGWLPAVGIVIGLTTGGLAWSFAQWWSAPVAVVLALAVEARVTGALHEDAVADFCDAFGGGRDAEHTLAILKDSRVGAYGMLGLVLAVVLRAMLLISALELGFGEFLLASVAASAWGRWHAVALLRWVPVSPWGRGLGSSLDQTSSWSLVLATLAGLPLVLGLGVVQWYAPLLALAGTALLIVWTRRLLVRRIGGLTGDCLGFVIYAGQLLLLLAATAG